MQMQPDAAMPMGCMLYAAGECEVLEVLMVWEHLFSSGGKAFTTLMGLLRPLAAIFLALVNLGRWIKTRKKNRI